MRTTNYANYAQAYDKREARERDRAVRRRGNKLDPDCDLKKADDLLEEKTKHGLEDYASILADVLMELPLGKPFGTFIPDDLIEMAERNLQKTRTILNKARTLELWEEVASLKEDIAFLEELISEGKTRGRPVDKATMIIFFWAQLAKRNGKVPWAMMRTLLRWFYERLKEMGYGYAVDIESITQVEHWAKETRRKEFKKRCTVKYETEKSVKCKITKSERAKIEKLLSDPKIMDSFLAWEKSQEPDQKPDWKDKHIKTIVNYQRGWLLNYPGRKFSPRAVKFSGDSIEIEMDYRNGGKLETSRWKGDLNTREFIKIDPDPKAVALWPVVFSS